MPLATHSSLDLEGFSSLSHHFSNLLSPWIILFFSFLLFPFPSTFSPLPFLPLFCAPTCILSITSSFLGHYSAEGLVRTAESWAPMPAFSLLAVSPGVSSPTLQSTIQSNPSSLQQTNGNNEEICKTKSCAHNLGWLLSYLRVFYIKQSTQRNEPLLGQVNLPLKPPINVSNCSLFI